MKLAHQTLVALNKLIAGLIHDKQKLTDEVKALRTRLQEDTRALKKQLRDETATLKQARERETMVFRRAVANADRVARNLRNQRDRAKGKTVEYKGYVTKYQRELVAARAELRVLRDESLKNNK